MSVLFQTAGNGSQAGTHDWLTPPEILHALGEFDLDPCASEFQPWRTAKQQFTIRDDGFSRVWHGRVWCNPPYGPFAARWLERCADHGNAIALVFARVDTASFQDHVFPKADAMLFLRGRLSFRLPGGGARRKCGCPVRPDRLWEGQCRYVGRVWPRRRFHSTAGC